jgi:hypothetical protein
MIFLNDRSLDTLVQTYLALDGYLSPSVAVRTQLPSANAPATWGSSVTVAPRTITVGAHLTAASLISRTGVIDTVFRACRGLRLFRTADAPDRESWVELTRCDVVFYDQAFTHTECMLMMTFTAADPTRYEREAVPLALSTARTAVPVGNVPSAPVLWLYGASPSVVDPVVIVRNAQGDETHRLTLTGTLATNDALVIDSARQSITRYVAGVVQTGTAAGNAWLSSGSFPLLAPEDAIDTAGVTVALSATTGTPTGLLLNTRGY